MSAYWLAGTPPRKTIASVPRLMPLARVSTRTSPVFGGRDGVERISPWPGATTQKARSSIEQALEHDVFAKTEPPRHRPQPL